VSDTTVKAVFKKVWSSPFKDVPEQAWYYESVRFVSANGLFNGIAPNTFNPEGSMTRGMFVTVLYRLSGNNGSNTNTFIDVPSGAWYEQAAAWAYTSGISGGVGDNRFAPDIDATREQLAVMLYNYAKYKGYDVSVGEDTNILSYGDAFSISEYAYSALQWACGAGIIDGDDNGNLNPRSFATRAEVAAILQRFIENVAG
jgi:hypothetical protein